MSGFSNSTNDSARKALRANARTIARKRALKDLLRKVHRTFWHGQLHEAFLRANHAVRPDATRPALTFSTVGQATRCRCAGRQRRPKSRQWAAWPRRISGVRNAPRRRAAASTRRRRAGRDIVSSGQLGKGSLRSRRAPSPRAELNLYQREKARQPASLRLGAAARSYGAPDTGNLRGPRPRAARADRAGIRLRTHPSGKAACGC